MFAPLQMSSTNGDGRIEDEDRIATFYEVRGDKSKPWRDVDLSQKWAGGGLLSTSSNLVRLCGGWFDSAYIEPATASAFLEPQRLDSGEVNPQSYAIGWRVEPESHALGEFGVTKRFHHGGVSKGAMSWLVCYPEYRLGVALNINSLTDDFMALANREPELTKLFIAKRSSWEQEQKATESTKSTEGKYSTEGE